MFKKNPNNLAPVVHLILAQFILMHEWWLVGSSLRSLPQIILYTLFNTTIFAFEEIKVIGKEEKYSYIWSLLGKIM